VSPLDLPTVTRRNLPTPAGPIAVLDVGRPDGDATPALLLPGFTGSKEDFAMILPPLAAAGRRVVAIDQRGQYESAGPDDPAAYTIEALATEVHTVLAELSRADRRPVHLLGHSFGGLVARAATIAEPAAVASLTLLGSGPSAIDGTRKERLQAIRPLLTRSGMSAVYEAMERLAESVDGRPPLPPALREFLRRRFLASSEIGLQVMGEALLTEPDRIDGLRETQVPVLVTHGVGDDAWPPAVQAEMARRLGARHEVIPAALHSPAVENPAATARVIGEFWTAVDAGRS
jgi:pimeloyl-ACP methyl ester carboxylesterase